MCEGKGCAPVSDRTKYTYSWSLPEKSFATYKEK